MEGFWLKRCPHCGNYIKKKDPQEAGMCCACGWQEQGVAFYCDLTNTFCVKAPRVERSF